MLFRSTSVGIVEADSFVSIYPNPSNEIFTIESTKNKIQSIKITTILGEEINGNPIIENKSCSFEMKDMPKGIYFISIFDEEKNVVNRKVVLQ